MKKLPKFFFEIILLLAVIVVALSFYFSGNIGGGSDKKTSFVIPLQIAGAEISAGVAATSEERAVGLSREGSLVQNEGMLFIFGEPSKYPFWMKDMKFPVDIIWVNEDRKVVGYEKDISPESYPFVFKPDISVKYVIEVGSGFVKKHGVKIGDIVAF